MRRWILPLLVVGSLLAGLWAFARTRPVAVDTAVVRRGPIRATVEEEGRTRVVDRFVVSAPVTGRLLRVELEPGAVVGKGALLAQIDPLPIAARVEEIEAQVRALRRQAEGVDSKTPKPGELEHARLLVTTAEESVEVARLELEELRTVLERIQEDRDRTRSLVRQQRLPGADLDVAETAHAQARDRVLAQEVRLRIRQLAVDLARLSEKVLADRLHDFDWEKRVYEEQIQGLEAALRSVRDELQRTDIPAPEDGVVLLVHLQSQQTVAAGTPILELGDLRRLEVEVDFLSEDAVAMREGMPAEVFGRALGDRVVGTTVKRIHPSAFTKVSSLGVEQQRVRVILDLDAEGLGLGDLYRVEVRVLLEERRDAVLVPEGALFRHAGAWHAFRVEGERAVLVRVETGLRDGLLREVLSGLAPGDVVVLHPGEAVEDGDRVEPLPAGQAGRVAR
jgi:HlyD family secretion protein